MTPFVILIAIAILLTVCSFIWQTAPFLQIAVLLIAIALLISRPIG